MPPPIPAVDGVTHREVDIPGVRLHVAEAGAGEPVLLLHGWPQHWWEWRKVIPELAGDHRLVMPDNRGFGWSGTPGHGYAPETFATDAVALLDVLGLDRVHVIGHDWGGFTALLLGLDHPERVRSVLAVSSPHPWIPQNLRTFGELWRLWYVLLMAAPVLGERILRGSRFVDAMDVGSPGVFSADEKEVYAAVLREPARARASSLLYRSYLRTAARSLRGTAYADRRFTVPTRLLIGGADAAIPVSWCTGLDRHGDDAATEVVASATHWLPESHPDLIAARARDLFARGS